MPSEKGSGWMAANARIPFHSNQLKGTQAACQAFVSRQPQLGKAPLLPGSGAYIVVYLIQASGGASAGQTHNPKRQALAYMDFSR
jgi:hypothetical protein